MTTAPDGVDTAVVADDLYKSFGETKALAGVSFRIERAKVVALLGPNGAGKTTAVRVLTTLIKPDAGRAYIDGIDVVAEPMRAKARHRPDRPVRRRRRAPDGDREPAARRPPVPHANGHGEGART